MVLTLLFDVETPFNQIRSQVNQMVHLINSPGGVIRETHSSKASVSHLEAFSPPTVPRLLVNKRMSVDEKSEGGFTTPLLEDVPSSMPKSEKKSQVDVKQNEQSLEKWKTTIPVPEAVVKRQESEESLSLEDRKQSSQPVIFDLSYFCMLIPRMPYHKLNGDLAVRLAEWVGQLCMAYGWRLEHLSVHPDYMQWVVNVVPSVVPDHLVDTLRHQISERIFAAFPQLRNDNPSGDFWAPGYLILTQFEQLSDQMVQDLIRQVRRYQGAPTADL
jgi:REP element-mobilizing transposase RayT